MDIMAHRIFFFAGGDFRQGKKNAFTANFIRYMTETLGRDFTLVEGIYHHQPLMNVLWALNHAQQPEKYPAGNRIIQSSCKQILADPQATVARLALVSSSYGSVVAAQVACQIAEWQLKENRLSGPFDLALGASMVSRESALYRKLLDYQQKEVIGTIIYDALQDDGDNSNGIGGTTRLEGYLNGLGICFPFLTWKFHGPSFLNQHPVSGHLHRVRSHSVQKAKDFLRTILIDYRLGGEEGRRKAEEKLRQAGGDMAPPL